jgi:hypothetical protein
MAFPKFNINIMFIELVCESLKNKSPLLYLPIRKTRTYFQHFPGTTKKRQLYVRMTCFSKQLTLLLQPLFDKMQTYGYLFISPENDILNDIDLEQLRMLIFQHTERRTLIKWIRLIRKSKKTWMENHPVFGKYLLLCSFLLAHAFSEQDLKYQFRLLNHKSSSKTLEKNPFSDLHPLL